MKTMNEFYEFVKQQAVFLSSKGTPTDDDVRTMAACDAFSESTFIVDSVMTEADRDRYFNEVKEYVTAYDVVKLSMALDFTVDAIMAEIQKQIIIEAQQTKKGVLHAIR